jgi:hypothetical protein
MADVGATYQERIDIATAITRGPGGYQVRVSETSPLILVKGGRLKGWVKFTPTAAARFSGLAATDADHALADRVEMATLEVPAEGTLGDQLPVEAAVAQAEGRPVTLREPEPTPEPKPAPRPRTR